ncbi:tRNA (adenosine(37)-N6)-threonylcarbamoyltransferase complex dimerization subunit type 1 TsaB [Deinococcus piscis]|uniref:tRNA (Adenosine(37)-N6)-threonylcarbamoyltransferase complex dimerization subunit type 1 TsaB n=1 Tax=Deinococcus piscis TaxID=394230 RepID=A0ABQ3K116_9DEIO|nr:tRNA (adenosine(37)-N6)-threonylcarbamoyltransferase complex dimerization subunit type 1 TsaB [Deinococcus piscis]GHF98872.1 tRNA (adenosine(37)-N6)-threonylcarbamoyltransferase complex dimerization subunit type 1 TsaB [Deinococcus piscis]
MITLALDTSTPYLTLALHWPGGELESAERIERAHAERLPSGVEALFQDAGLELRADRIVIGMGPGSYTGVRIGASYALALARVWSAELTGVSTLCALLSEQPGTQAPALDARKDNVYGALYRVEASGVAELQAPAKYAQADFVALAQQQGAELRQETTPSGLSLIRAAQTLGRAQPQLHLSYL